MDECDIALQIHDDGERLMSRGSRRRVVVVQAVKVKCARVDVLVEETVFCEKATTTSLCSVEPGIYRRFENKIV